MPFNDRRFGGSPFNGITFGESGGGSTPTWTANNDILQPLDDDMVAYWSGEDLTDSKGSHTLTNNNSVTFTSGKYNNAFTLNGSNQNLTASDSDDFVWADDVTISAWVYFSSLSGAQCLMSQVNGNNYMYFHKESDGTMYMLIRGTNSCTVRTSSSAFASTNTWYHVVLSVISGVPKIYIDGSSKALQDNAWGGGNDIPAMLYIGSAPTSIYLNGQLDQVSIHKYGMTASEVTALCGSYYIG